MLGLAHLKNNTGPAVEEIEDIVVNLVDLFTQPFQLVFAS